MSAVRKLTHLDGRGRMRMVDTSGKRPSLRKARARGEVQMTPQALEQIAAGTLVKGDVLAAARLAGIAAAKQTPALVPLIAPDRSSFCQT